MGIHEKVQKKKAQKIMKKIKKKKCPMPEQLREVYILEMARCVPVLLLLLCFVINN